MSDLQLALIAIGALIILAVLILNWWQERRFHRQVESNFDALKNDALLTDAALPTDEHSTDNFSIDVQVDLDATESAPAQVGIELIDDAMVPAVELPVEPSPITVELAPAQLTAALPLMLKVQIDTTALLYLATESTVASVKNACEGLFDGLDKPVFLHALDASNAWHLLDETDANANDQAVYRVACSLQLADRGGAVSRSSLSRFQLAVANLAHKINADIEQQDIDDIQAQASHIDAFCIDVDKTVGFHLRHGEHGAFTGMKLKALAAAQGLMLEDGGFFQANNRITNKPSFIVFNTENQPFSADTLSDSLVNGITFQLDIPRVDQCALAFDQMVEMAKQMALELNAKLLDANNQALSDLHIEQIRQQLNTIQETMLTQGIAPGSDAALRLFS